jgi:hypothetical protein
LSFAGTLPTLLIKHSQLAQHSAFGSTAGESHSNLDAVHPLLATFTTFSNKDILKRVFLYASASGDLFQ